MADAYMGWTLDYAKRMLPLLEPFHLRWLEEPVIPDDIHGYAELKSYGRIPIAGGEHEFTLYGFRDLLEARAVDYIQFDTNRVGGITQARKIAALAEAHSVPVIPHAGQMHNYHVVMASLNSPMAEYFPVGGRRSRQRIVLVYLQRRARAKDGFIDLDENAPGPGPDHQRKSAGAISRSPSERRTRHMTRLIQIRKGDDRAVALVEEPSLRLLRRMSFHLRAGQCGYRSGIKLSDAGRQRVTGDYLDYDAIYSGKSEWRLLPPIDHPEEPARCLVSGTGLTHFGSARDRQTMHAVANEAE